MTTHWTGPAQHEAARVPGRHGRPSLDRMELLDYAPSGDAAQPALDDGPATTEACSLPAEPASVKAARDFATAALRCWEMPGLIDDMGLVVSELVTNALNHAAPSCPENAAAAARTGAAEDVIRLNLIRRGSEVICTVGDCGTDAPIRQDVQDVAETGRGLLLVECVSQAWGWTPLRDSGKVVWALLAESD